MVSEFIVTQETLSNFRHRLVLFKYIQWENPQETTNRNANLQANMQVMHEREAASANCACVIGDLELIKAKQNKTN